MDRGNLCAYDVQGDSNSAGTSRSMRGAGTQELLERRSRGFREQRGRVIQRVRRSTARAGNNVEPCAKPFNSRGWQGLHRVGRRLAVALLSVLSATSRRTISTRTIACRRARTSRLRSDGRDTEEAHFFERRLGIPTVDEQKAANGGQDDPERDVEPQFHRARMGMRPHAPLRTRAPVRGDASGVYAGRIGWMIRGFLDNLDHALVMRAVRKTPGAGVLLVRGCLPLPRRKTPWCRARWDAGGRREPAPGQASSSARIAVPLRREVADDCAPLSDGDAGAGPGRLGAMPRWPPSCSHAARGMRAGPSEPPGRGRLQTAVRCLGQEPRW